MEAVFTNWYNANELRNYPLDDVATRISTGGVTLPMDSLVDLSIRYPDNIVGVPFVSAMAVTNRLASVVVSLDTASGEVVLGAVTVVNPVQYRHYRFMPIHPGVGGWAVFGAGITEQNDLRLQFDVAGGRLAPRTARSYPSPPVTSIMRENRSDQLKGMVSLLGINLVEVIVADEPWTGTPDYILHPRQMRLFNGVQQPSLVVHLRRSAGYSELAQFLGECVNSTQIGCDPPIIQSINRVKPDANGNITLEVRGIPTELLVDTEGNPEGLALESPLGTIDICDPEKGLIVYPPPEPDCE